MTSMNPVAVIAADRLLPVLVCDHCDTTESVSPRFCDWNGNLLGYECDRCADREPGDSYYEDHGSARHELQDAYGGWHR